MVHLILWWDGVYFLLGVIPMALEALQRNGHNLGLGAFVCEGPFDTPKLTPVQLDERLDWISFNRAATQKRRNEYGVHFFVDDYLFERTWHDPRRYALLLSEFRAVMTPDFSLFTDYPRAVQIEDSFHIKRPVATLLPLRLLPQMVFQNHVAFPGSQAAGISTVRTKQRCVP